MTVVLDCRRAAADISSLLAMKIELSWSERQGVLPLAPSSWLIDTTFSLAANSTARTTATLSEVAVCVLWWKIYRLGLAFCTRPVCRFCPLRPPQKGLGVRPPPFPHRPSLPAIHDERWPTREGRGPQTPAVWFPTEHAERFAHLAYAPHPPDRCRPHFRYGLPVHPCPPA